MDHKSVNLELRTDKPDNVYRFIYAWHTVKSSHGSDIYYLMIHALVQWENVSVDTFCILMQYSNVIGKNVDVSQPAHILEEDIDQVNTQWSSFTSSRKGKK
jgi:hypothetical protein